MMPSPFMKLDWEMVQRMLPASDSPDIVALTNTGGNRVKIPVRLYKNGNPVLNATVTFFQASKQLSWAALSLVECDLEENKAKIDWDAVSFKEHVVRYARKDRPDDPFADKVRNYRMIELFSAAKRILDESETGNKNDPKMVDYAALILAHSAEIDIPGLKRLPRRYDPAIEQVLRKLEL